VKITLASEVAAPARAAAAPGPGCGGHEDLAPGRKSRRRRVTRDSEMLALRVSGEPCKGVLVGLSFGLRLCQCAAAAALRLSLRLRARVRKVWRRGEDSEATVARRREIEKKRRGRKRRDGGRGSAERCREGSPGPAMSDRTGTDNRTYN
jgi:hypothetical protein